MTVTSMTLGSIVIYWLTTYAKTDFVLWTSAKSTRKVAKDDGKEGPQFVPSDAISSLFEIAERSDMQRQSPTLSSSPTSNSRLACPRACSCDAREGIVSCTRFDSLAELADVVRNPKFFDSIRVSTYLVSNQPRITSLERKDIEVFVKIEKISVVHTNLKTISLDAFDNLLTLTDIHLSHNAINVLSWEIFRNLFLRTLIVAENPFHCVCANIWTQSSRTAGFDVEGSKKKLLSQCIPPESKSALDRLLQCQSPRPRLSSARVVVRAGEVAEVSCDVDISVEPEVTLEWDLGVSGPPFVVRRSHTATRLVSTLLVPNISSTASGVVACRAESVVGQFDAYATIVVEGPPAILRLETLRSAGQAFPAAVFLVIGHPTPLLRWAKNGRPFLQPPEVIADVFDHFDRRGVTLLRMRMIPCSSHVVGVFNSYSLQRRYCAADDDNHDDFVVEGQLNFRKGAGHMGWYTLTATNEFGSTNRSVLVDGHDGFSFGFPPPFNTNRRKEDTQKKKTKYPVTWQQ